MLTIQFTDQAVLADLPPGSIERQEYVIGSYFLSEAFEHRDDLHLVVDPVEFSPGATKWPDVRCYQATPSSQIEAMELDSNAFYSLGTLMEAYLENDDLSTATVTHDGVSFPLVEALNLNTVNHDPESTRRLAVALQMLEDRNVDAVLEPFGFLIAATYADFRDRTLLTAQQGGMIIFSSTTSKEN